MTIVDDDPKDFMPTHPFVRGPSVTFGPLAAALLEQRERAEKKAETAKPSRPEDARQP